MATTFSLFYLGIAPIIDTTEGNLTSENHTALNNMFFGGTGFEIYKNLQELSPISYAGGGTTSYDANESTSADTFSIDGGAAQTHDTTMLYNNTVITYTDGTSTTVDAIVMQDSTGATYLLPPTTGPNAYSDALEAKPIASVTLGTAAPSGGTNVYGMTADRYVLDIQYVDTDNDGVVDPLDIDADNDGILNVDEGYSETIPTTITITFDGDSYAPTETSWELRDASGTLIASDTTILTTVEITNVAVTDLGNYTFSVFDTWGDGMFDGTGTASYQVAVDGVTVIDSGPKPNFGTGTSHVFAVEAEVTATDSDGDGIFDYLDLDSDNDGITDNVEAQTTADYKAPTGTDTDGDGLDDAYDATPTTGAAGSDGLMPENSDGTGLADFLDTDSDDDGIDDADEAGHGVTQAALDAAAASVAGGGAGDADGDGILDLVDDVDGWDVNDNDIDGSGNFTLADTDDDTAADGSNAAPPTTDLDYRDTVPCFTPGTMITTANGDVPVEDIRPGDMVLTVDNGFQPVRWVGSRTVAGAELARHAHLRPIVIRKGAFGNRRKMRVSPQHGLVVNDSGVERLIRAKHIVETMGGKFARVDWRCERITYIHLMFEKHELLYAEGGKTEAFYPGPVVLKSMPSAILAELLAIFPELSDVAFGEASTTTTYGCPVRPYLKRHEAREIAVQNTFEHQIALAPLKKAA